MAARTGGLHLPTTIAARLPRTPRPRTVGAVLARSWTIIALVGIVAFGAGLRAAQATDPGRYLSSDERSYARVGMSLAQDGVYAPHDLGDPWHWAPGTPALFALAHLVHPSADGTGAPAEVRTAFWAQALVGTALIVVVFLLAAGIAGPLAGLAAAAAIAAYPPLVSASGDLVSEPLGALTLALALLALLGAWRRPGAGRFALAGLALGLALLTRADLLVLPGVLGVAWAALAWRRAGAGAALAQAAAIAIVPLLVIAPWVAYASSEAGRLVPIASSGPSTLFVGTYLPAGGKLSGVKRELEPYVRRHMPNLSDVSRPNLRGSDVLRAYVRERHPELIPAPYRAIPEADLRQALAFEARRNLKTYALGQPLAFARMELGKVARMWAGYARGGTHGERAWLTVWHRLLLALALTGTLAGLVLGGRRRPELVLLLVPVATSTAVNAVFVAQARHNLRVLPLLVAAGSAGAVLAARELRRRRRPGLPLEADPPGSQITVERRALTEQAPEIRITRRTRRATRARTRA